LNFCFGISDTSGRVRGSHARSASVWIESWSGARGGDVRQQSPMPIVLHRMTAWEGFKHSQSRPCDSPTIMNLSSHLWEIQARTTITIIPSGNLSWMLLMMTILFNELDDTWSRGATARVLQNGSRRADPGPYIQFLFECEDTTLERWLELKVYPGNWSLKVEASREWILIQWEQDSTTMHSIEATKHRSVQRAHGCEMIHYH
jgi:hypothetical protein